MKNENNLFHQLNPSRHCGIVGLGDKWPTKSHAEIHLIFHLKIRAYHLCVAQYNEYKQFLFDTITDFPSQVNISPEEIVRQSVIIRFLIGMSLVDFGEPMKRCRFYPENPTCVNWQLKSNPFLVSEATIVTSGSESRWKTCPILS